VTRLDAIGAAFPTNGECGREPGSDEEARPHHLARCRHTFASLKIAAGVNAKALAVYMGHTSVMITVDRYGRLFPGSEEEAAGLLDGYLARAVLGADLQP
jgi:hypothetical protein